ELSAVALLGGGFFWGGLVWSVWFLFLGKRGGVFKGLGRGGRGGKKKKGEGGKRKERKERREGEKGRKRKEAREIKEGGRNEEKRERIQEYLNNMTQEEYRL
ncbi:hypothetical protein, partial [Klebsiella variicola]|uniref:hypothetical protein n=1 Tax=Klebsiella variicola TaxID=244366 RepID=UPI003D02DD83